MQRDVLRRTSRLLGHAPRTRFELPVRQHGYASIIAAHKVDTKSL